MTERTCPACGNVVAASTRFCQSCGTPLGEPAEESKAAPVPNACPSCGTLATAPGQRFCAACGSAMDAAAQPAEAQPVTRASSTSTSGSTAAAAPATATAAATAAASGNQMKVDVAQMRSRFDDFMGASVDVGAVGQGFSPQSIVLDGDDDPRLVEAFAFFGKVYLAPDEAPAEEIEEVLAPRAEPEEGRPRAKERRDFSARKGGFAYGELITKLHSSAAPSVRMVEDMRGKALEHQSKGREKRKAVLNA